MLLAVRMRDTFCIIIVNRGPCLYSFLTGCFITENDILIFFSLGNTFDINVGFDYHLNILKDETMFVLETNLEI